MKKLWKIVYILGATPLLTKFEIPTITSVVKKFLRSLKEPVIPLSLWQVFVDAATNPDTTDAEAAMYQAVSELPLPNRDTLAYLIVHLQTIADNSIFNKMDKDNLAVIMGPTILGKHKKIVKNLTVFFLTKLFKILIWHFLRFSKKLKNN